MIPTAYDAAFAAKVSAVPTERGCREWQGGRNADGYGLFYWYEDGKKRKGLAHRIAWARKNGPIPDGVLIRHSCDNPACCEDEHLLSGSNLDNMQDRKARGRYFGTPPLSDEDKAAIRHRFMVGQTYKQLASEYRVSNTTLKSILEGEKQ